jgi:hypothetical protein
MNTTFRKIIPMRWCCIDQLSRHAISDNSRLFGHVAGEIHPIISMNALPCSRQSRIMRNPIGGLADYGE